MAWRTATDRCCCRQAPPEAAAPTVAVDTTSPGVLAVPAFRLTAVGSEARPPAAVEVAQIVRLTAGEMATALLESRLLYGAEVWDELTPPALDTLAQAQMRWLRAIVGDRRCSGEVQWTDD